jgi:hypothetical protein
LFYIRDRLHRSPISSCPPFSPGAVQPSASSTLRSFSFAVNRRRSVIGLGQKKMTETHRTYQRLEEKELTSLDLPLPDMPITYICAAGADRGTRTRGDAAAT